MTEEMGFRAEAPPPLPSPQGNEIPWHHKTDPIGGSLNAMSVVERVAERAAIRAVMTRILMPDEALPTY